MKVAYYADDFTGAVDGMLQFRHAGLTGVLTTSLAEAERVAAATPESELEVLGIAGVARSLATAVLGAELQPLFTWMVKASAPIIQYKACSTADSSPDLGSLGRVCEIALSVVGQQAIPVVFAQPGFGRYTFFGHHFADEAGHVFRLDRQPTMRTHPSTPMTESDLVRHLRKQTDLPIENLVWTQLSDTSDPAGSAAAALSGTAARIVVCDAFTESHLNTLGNAVTATGDGPRFVLGSGGLSLGIGRALGGAAPPLPRSVEAASSPGLVLSGSRSPRTWEQIQAAVAAGWSCVDLRSPDAAARAVTLLATGHETIVHTTDPAGATLPQHEIIDGLTAVGRASLERNPHGRLVLCGGDTCGAILRALGIHALTLLAAPWGNVALCSGMQSTGRSVEVVLKGGQMGHTHLFEDIRRGRALNQSGEHTPSEPT